MSGEHKDRDLTLRIPASLGPLLEEARRAFGVTHAEGITGAELLLMLIERGARMAIDHAEGRPDHRPLTSLTAADLADIFGMRDLDAMRKASRDAREEREKIARELGAAFKDVQGLCTATTPMRRIASIAELEAFLGYARNVFATSPGHTAVLALAWVHDGPSCGPAHGHAPVN